MKMNYLIIVLVMMAAISTGCHRRVVVVKRTPAHRLPPGQAKKLTGTQSARSYAPGHQKKKG